MSAKADILNDNCFSVHLPASVLSNMAATPPPRHCLCHISQSALVEVSWKSVACAVITALNSFGGVACDDVGIVSVNVRPSTSVDMEESNAEGEDKM